MDHAAWMAARGDHFAVRAVDGAGAPVDLRLRLRDVSDLVVDGGFSTYVLHFSGPAALPLDQGTIAMRHLDDGSGDELAIFVVPIGEAADERTYEAVFSQVLA